MRIHGLCVAILIGLSGCGTQNAVFVTKTSFSVLDVDTTPAGVSVAHDRVEGYFGPRFANGTVYPVTGYFYGTGSSFSRNVRQVFAGGDAARLVLGGEAAGNPEATCNDNRTAPPLIFATGTTVGLKLGFAEGTAIPSSVVFGFKRKEAASVPVSQECQPSVLATLDSDAESRTEAADPKFGLAARQYFATGAAADILAKDGVVRAIFQTEAQKAVGPVDAFKSRAAVQAALAQETLACAARVADGSFNSVVVNAKELGLLERPDDDQRILGQASPDARLKLYGALLRLRNGDVDPRTSAMELHKRRVCGLAAPA